MTKNERIDNRLQTWVQRIEWYANQAAIAAPLSKTRIEVAQCDAYNANLKAKEALSAALETADTPERTRARELIFDAVYTVRLAADVAGWRGKVPWESTP